MLDSHVSLLQALVFVWDPMYICWSVCAFDIKSKKWLNPRLRPSLPAFLGALPVNCGSKQPLCADTQLCCRHQLLKRGPIWIVMAALLGRECASCACMYLMFVLVCVGRAHYSWTLNSFPLIDMQMQIKITRFETRRLESSKSIFLFSTITWLFQVP